MRRCLIIIMSIATATTSLQAAPPTEAKLLTEIVGKPTSLHVTPEAVSLVGVRTSQQLLVAGRYSDGSTRDLTAFCEWVVSDDKLIDVTSSGLVSGRSDGATTIEVRVAQLAVVVPVEVSDTGRVDPIRFRRDVVPVLSVAGCSDIRCHGAPSGKSGFRLSLWGSNPDLDFAQLSRDAFGRRTNAFRPDDSLILLKATARVSHVAT